LRRSEKKFAERTLEKRQRGNQKKEKEKKIVLSEKKSAIGVCSFIKQHRRNSKQLRRRLIAFKARG
jgi:hypothetical protein